MNWSCLRLLCSALLGHKWLLFPRSNPGLAQCTICDLQHCYFCTETCFCAPPAGGNRALTLGTLAGFAQPQPARQNILMSDGCGGFDPGEEQEHLTGEQGNASVRSGGRWDASIWEEPELCAHPTELFMSTLLSHVQHLCESPEE